MLTDRNTVAGVHNYSEGSGTEFMVEIHPDRVQPAKEFRMIPERNGLRGIGLEDGELRLRLLHNPSGQSVDFGQFEFAGPSCAERREIPGPLAGRKRALRELRNSRNVELVQPHSHIVLRA